MNKVKADVIIELLYCIEKFSTLDSASRTV